MCYNCLPEILKLWSNKLLWCFLPVFANSAALEPFIRSTEKPQQRTVNGNAVWTSDAHSTAQVKEFKSASISVINFKAFRNHGSSAKRGEISQAIIWSSSVWWSTSFGISRGSWGRVVICALHCQVWLILQDSRCYVGPPGKFLKTGILAGTRLRKFPWFVSIDFNATMLPLLAGENHVLSASLLWGPSFWVFRVKESSHELWVTANCCAFGKTLKNGRDLKAEILTDLSWVKNSRELRQQLLGEEKCQQIT